MFPYKCDRKENNELISNELSLYTYLESGNYFSLRINCEFRAKYITKSEQVDVMEP